MSIANNIIRFDIETVPLFASEEEAVKDTTGLYSVWKDKYCKTKPDDMSVWDWYWERSALTPEFSKIVCISRGRLEIKKVNGSTEPVNGTNNYIKGSQDIEAFRCSSFYGDEKTILQEFADLLSHEAFTNWNLGGHNIKGFDISFVAKRMIINGITLPPMINVLGKKPREITHIDTQEMRQFGRGVSTGLELMCLVLGVESPKQEITGKEVKDIYYHPTMLDKDKEDIITRYCQNDVVATYDCYRTILAHL